METKEQELSRCREELEYWAKAGIEYFIWCYTERIKELEGEEDVKTV